jgi:hypothetical protein
MRVVHLLHVLLLRYCGFGGGARGAHGGVGVGAGEARGDGHGLGGCEGGAGGNGRRQTQTRARSRARQGRVGTVRTSSTRTTRTSFAIAWRRVWARGDRGRGAKARFVARCTDYVRRAHPAQATPQHTHLEHWCGLAALSCPASRLSPIRHTGSAHGGLPTAAQSPARQPTGRGHHSQASPQ